MTAPAKEKAKAPIKTQRAKMTPKSDTTVPDVRVPSVQWVHLIPARYALGDHRSRLPILKKQFHVDGPDIHQKTGTHYTLRRPRPGYIYIFHKKYQAWSLCKADGNGGLKALLMPEEGDEQKDCFAMMDVWDNGVLAILDDDPIWLAFSDVRWTKATLDKGRNNTHGFRDRHMRYVDPQAWKRQWNGIPHAAPLNETPDCVADFKPGMDKDAFWYSAHRTFPWLPWRYFIANLEEYPGAVVALDDPAGIAMDLASLMLARLERWSLEPASGFDIWNQGKPKERQVNRKWAATTGGAIDSLKESLAQRVELQAYEAETSNMIAYAADPRTRSGLWTPLMRNFYSQPSRISRAQEERAKSWDKYAVKYDAKTHAKWMEDYYKQLAPFDESDIKPLAEAHVAWVEGAPFKDHFKDVYDSTDVPNGIRFAQTLASCYMGVQNKDPCKEHMMKWLKEKVNAENLINRALVLNLEEVWNQLDAASSPDEIAHHAATLSGLAKWKSVIKQFAKCVEKHEDLKNATLARFFGVFASPLSHVAKDGAAAMPSGLVAASVASGDTLETVVLNGKPRDFRRALFEALLKNFGSAGLSRNQMRDAANLQLAYLEKQGVPMDGTAETKILVKKNPDASGGALKGLSRSKQSQAMANTFQLEPEAAEYTLPGADPARPGEMAPEKASLGPASILSGILGSLLQYAAFCKISEDLNKAMNCDKKELQVRWVAQLGAMIGSTMETLGKLMERLPCWALEGEAASSVTLNLLKIGGPLIGAAGGLIAAGMDFVKWQEAREKGQVGLAFCYLTSGVIGGAIGLLSILALCGVSVPVWGWILAIAAFLIGQIISAIKPDKVQNWLEQCCWGVGDRFKTMVEEQQQLGLATAG